MVLYSPRPCPSPSWPCVLPHGPLFPSLPCLSSITFYFVLYPHVTPNHGYMSLSVSLFTVPKVYIPFHSLIHAMWTLSRFVPFTMDSINGLLYIYLVHGSVFCTTNSILITIVSHLPHCIQHVQVLPKSPLQCTFSVVFLLITPYPLSVFVTLHYL